MSVDLKKENQKILLNYSENIAEMKKINNKHRQAEYHEISHSGVSEYI